MTLSSRLAVAVLATESEGLAETLALARTCAAECVVGVWPGDQLALAPVRAAGARIVELPVNATPAEARNVCLNELAARWVLWLEPGERLDADGIDALDELLAESPSHERAYRCLVCMPSLGKHPTVECRSELRLHPRLTNVRFEGLVRESIEDGLKTAGCEIENLTLRIERTALPNDSARRMRCAQRTLRQADAALASNNRSPRMLNGLGEALQAVGDAARAASLYREALELATYRSADELEAWYGLLTSLDGAPDGRSAQLQLAMQALESFPVDAQLLCALGGYLQSLGHMDLAAQSYLVAWRHGQVTSMVEHLEDIREIAGACHAGALHQLGNQEAACRFVQSALDEYPESSRLRTCLREILAHDATAMNALRERQSRSVRLDAAGPMRAPAFEGQINPAPTGRVS